MAEEAEDVNQLERVQQFIKGEVQQYLQQSQQDTAQQQAVAQQQYAAQQQQAVNPQQAAYNQVNQFVRGIVQPDIQDAKFAAADAVDRSNFYSTHPLAREYEKEVEEAYKTMVQMGRPTMRADVLRYLRGKEADTDPDAFLKKEQARTKVRSTAFAGDMGADAVTREKSDQLFENFDKLSVEDMEKRLDGVTF
jgi:hypothetical protein